jgi:hypothetical protein
MNDIVEFFQVVGAVIAVSVMAFFGAVFVLLCTPYPWLALMVYFILRCV